MRLLSCLALIIFLGTGLNAQYHQDVFKGDVSNDLLIKLQQNYTPTTQLDYSEARDTMFLNIDSRNRVLQCVYTGLQIEIPVGEDPTTAVFMNGANNGINTEHTYPRSKGAADEPQVSDMHNLYPTRVKTNSDRQSFEFGEIPDSQTDRWYRGGSESTNIPTSNIDEYSELDTNGEPRFEPREDHKGDVARSMMYFYSIHRREAMQAAPTYFERQREVLCDWHYLDPVDQKEWERTFKIAKYQDGKTNPFVLDCSLAARLYCDQISDACALLTDDEVEELVDKFTVWPNPFDGQELYFLFDNAAKGKVNIMDISGKSVFKRTISIQNGKNKITFNRSLVRGLYFILLEVNGARHYQKVIVD